MTRKRIIAALAGGVAALLLLGSALAHPGGGIVDRVEVLAGALGLSTAEVETARADGTLKELLAEVSRDDLREAYEAAASEAIDAAAADGAITPAQADRLHEAVSADRPDLDKSDRAELRSLRGVAKVDVVAVHASVLGITSAEVEAAKADGTLRELLAGANRVALAAALLDAREAAIAQALADGEITSEQAELLRVAGASPGRGKQGGWHGKRGGCDKDGDKNRRHKRGGTGWDRDGGKKDATDAATGGSA